MAAVLSRERNRSASFQALLGGIDRALSGSRFREAAQPRMDAKIARMNQDARVRRKLIEVDLPLAAINKESAREKSLRHGHPSTLHLYWGAAAAGRLPGGDICQPGGRPRGLPRGVPDSKKSNRRSGNGCMSSSSGSWSGRTCSRTAMDDVLGEARREIARSLARGRGESAPTEPGAVLDLPARACAAAARPLRRRRLYSAWKRSGSGCEPLPRTSTR